MSEVFLDSEIFSLSFFLLNFLFLSWHEKRERESERARAREREKVRKSDIEKEVGRKSER